MTTTTRGGTRRRLLLLLSILACLGTTPAAAGLEVEIAGETRAEIGQDLVLELLLTSDEPVPLDALVVTPTAGADFVGAPYPLRVLTTDRTPAGNAVPAGNIRVEWAAPVAADASAGDRELVIEVRAGAATATWSGTVAVEYGGDWSADRISAFIDQRGLLPFLVLVFGFGILMSLSPCIYPMIPITLAVIGGQSQEKGALKGLGLSVTYVVGMALVYAVLGALSATVFSGITAFMQSPVVVGPIALLLVVLSFAMFGAYELQAPAFLRDRLQSSGGGGGLVGVFVMGMVAGLVASPCVGPFLAALLVWVGSTGNWVLGFFSLFTFGIGMGLLLIGVGTFPALLGSMPRSGGWMETVKRAMGLLLLAMAFWFVRPGIFLPARIFEPLVGGTIVLVSVFMGAFDPVTVASTWWDRTRKGLGLIALVAGVIVVAGSLLPAGILTRTDATTPAPVTVAPSVVPTGPGSAAGTVVTPAPPAKVVWEKIHTGENVRAFLDTRLAEAKAAGQPVMIDFWAEWCFYCRKLDKDVWAAPEVAAESARFLTIKVDATATDDDEMTAIKEELRVPGLPRVIFIDSRGEVLHGRTSTFKPAAEMLAVMQGVR